jgi:hypothetical protein
MRTPLGLQARRERAREGGTLKMRDLQQNATKIASKFDRSA